MVFVIFLRVCLPDVCSGFGVDCCNSFTAGEIPCICSAFEAEVLWLSGNSVPEAPKSIKNQSEAVRDQFRVWVWSSTAPAGTMQGLLKTNLPAGICFFVTGMLRLGREKKTNSQRNTEICGAEWDREQKTNSENDHDWSFYFQIL